ncbi:MAG: methyltransferase [Bacteroidales bacterium]|nr:methyltransferase [Bacteroidales bacterium]MDY6001703.1 methyltransferase [Candidatus Cryptobacteroides sp.]
MKVGTDGVLLGSATEVSMNTRSALDIGTGCGLIALMLAQRLALANETFCVTGIDIEDGAAADAAENFRMSPWSGNLESKNMSLVTFANAFPDAMFDLIVSNPPYYDNSLEAPNVKRNVARHTRGSLMNIPYSDGVLSYKEIFEYAKAHLAEDGSLWLILPADQEKELLRYARMLRLKEYKILRIKSVVRKPPFRIIVAFRRGKTMPIEEELVLLDGKGRRTLEHASLTKDYYL